ncbi:MAG: sel1 repeat family protein, partial [Atopobiaceae bacterium]|nr:sel1 repeat family protein [Atopobiaceae bacterium]
AENGSHFGQGNLADCYHLGTGVAKDTVEAYHWYLKAAEQGNAYTQFRVGKVLEEGRGGRKDLAEAATW